MLKSLQNSRRKHVSLNSGNTLTTLDRTCKIFKGKKMCLKKKWTQNSVIYLQFSEPKIWVAFSSSWVWHFFEMGSNWFFFYLFVIPACFVSACMCVHKCTHLFYHLSMMFRWFQNFHSCINLSQVRVTCRFQVCEWKFTSIPLYPKIN